MPGAAATFGEAEPYLGDNLVLIVGCPRSGTTWLQKLLFAHPKVKSGRESHVFHYVAPQLERWRKLLEGDHEGLACHLTDEAFVRKTRAYLRSLLEPMVGGLAADELFLEKTPQHFRFLPQIFELLPRVKVIYVRRDPRDVVASLLAASRSWGKTWAPGDARAAATMWLRSMEMLEWAKSHAEPSQLLEVAYEGLFASPEAELRRCADFLKLEWTDAEVRHAIDSNRANTEKPAEERLPVKGEMAKRVTVYQEPAGKTRRAHPGGWREDLRLQEKLAVYLLLRKMMARYGYAWPTPMRVLEPVDGFVLGGMSLAGRVRKRASHVSRKLKRTPTQLLCLAATLPVSSFTTVQL